MSLAKAVNRIYGTMHTRHYGWRVDGVEHSVHLVPVPGTNGRPYLFGSRGRQRPIEIRDFHIMTTPVTQELWTYVMGSNPSVHAAPHRPVENISWHDVTRAGGFLDRVNASPIAAAMADGGSALRFRLPSETEWEYAARGGPHWKDGFRFSGSNDAEQVAWYGRRFSASRQIVCRLLGWPLGWRLATRFVLPNQTRTHPVAAKAPNQLGLYDMSGNVWEWCEDACGDDLDLVPQDGAPCRGPGTDRRLRGGCHHNWDIHCTVSFRYGIAPDSHDGCIGFRLVLAP